VKESLLRFPCDFPIKIIGLATEGFAQTVVDIIKKHAPDFDAASLEMRASRESRYLSLTCVIRAVSRDQLDALYREVSGHPLVKVVL
jgi:uncharacterized protein